jgi:hypothetical protein
MFEPGQRVRANLAGMVVEGVTFHAAVTDALGTVVSRVSEDPPAWIIDLAFAFRGVKQVQVPEERLRPA